MKLSSAEIVLLVLILITLIVVTTAFFILSRPRIEAMQADDDLDEDEKLRLGIEHHPSNWNPNVLFVVSASSESDGANQYSLPTMEAYCRRQRYDLRIVRHYAKTPFMGCLEEIERVLKRDPQRYDYIIAFDGYTVLTKPSQSVLPLLWRYMEKHPERLASINEDCRSGMFCNNFYRAYQLGNIESLFSAVPGTEMMLVKVRDDTVEFIERWATMLRAGHEPEVDWSERVGVFPHNILNVRGNTALTDSGATSSPILGVHCSTVRQVRDAYDASGGSHDHMSLREMKHRQGENAAIYTFDYGADRRKIISIEE